MGLGADKAYERWREKHPYKPRSKTGGRWHDYVSYWLHRMGPPALLFSWLPLVGDPLCAVAGWLRLSFWPCMFYMAIGKFLRYLTMTAALLWLFPETHSSRAPQVRSIARASCREGVCTSVYISVVAVSLKKHKITQH